MCHAKQTKARTKPEEHDHRIEEQLLHQVLADTEPVFLSYNSYISG